MITNEPGAAYRAFAPRIGGDARSATFCVPPPPPAGGLLMGWLVSMARRGCDSQQHTSSTRRDCRRYRLRVGALVSLLQRVLLYSYLASAAASPLNETVSAELLAGGELLGSPMGAGSARQLQDAGSARQLQDAGSVSHVGFMSAGEYHSCGVSADGTGYCWGYNDDGQSTVPSGVAWAAIRGHLPLVRRERGRHGLLLGE